MFFLGFIFADKPDLILECRSLKISRDLVYEENYIHQKTYRLDFTVALASQTDGLVLDTPWTTDQSMVLFSDSSQFFVIRSVGNLILVFSRDETYVKPMTSWIDHPMTLNLFELPLGEKREFEFEQYYSDLEPGMFKLQVIYRTNHLEWDGLWKGQVSSNICSVELKGEVE